MLDSYAVICALIAGICLGLISKGIKSRYWSVVFKCIMVLAMLLSVICCLATTLHDLTPFGTSLIGLTSCALAGAIGFGLIRPKTILNLPAENNSIYYSEDPTWEIFYFRNYNIPALISYYILWLSFIVLTVLLWLNGLFPLYGISLAAILSIIGSVALYFALSAIILLLGLTILFVEICCVEILCLWKHVRKN